MFHGEEVGKLKWDVMLLKLFGWIEIVSDDDQFVAITEKGNENHRNAGL